MADSRNSRSPEAALARDVAAVLAAAGVGVGQRLCLGFSGGVDSSVLLHLLAGLRPRFGFELVAAHVHHGLSPDADAWQRACAAQCAALGVPLHAFRVTVARGDPAGLEAAARAARRAALAQVDCDWLVSAHHQDDQAETVLFRLLRGTGLRGAAAMAPIEPGRPGRLRPLLAVRRADIVACAEAHGLSWVEDESNADVRHARNFLRHRIFPALETTFPGAVPALTRAAEHFREADELLDALAAQDAAVCGEPLAREALLALPDARLRNLLRWCVRRQGGEAPARARLVEAVRQLRAAARDHPLHLCLGATMCCAYRDVVWVEPGLADAPARAVAWRGEAELAWGAGRVRFEATRGGGLRRAALARATVCELVPRWPGLAMRQGAGRPRRSFKNLCQEAGIPAWLRPHLPVLRVDGAAAWIGELGVAAEFACAPDEEGVSAAWLR